MAAVSAVLLTLSLVLAVTSHATLPHIVIIVADDLGWNDVGFHGSNQIPTPNIDALAYSGVILRNYYTQPICTPARAALLTARHPIHNGMENDVLAAPEPWGLPLTERVMPQHLQALGYVTRAVGKWHLGFFQSDYTPTRRGFDSHFGIWLGMQDHYTHFGYKEKPGYDFRRDLNVNWEAQGKYSADLFTEEAESVIHSHDVDKPLFLYLCHTAPHAPLQAPQETIDKFQYIPDPDRQVFAAMVSKVDESVGRVSEALRARNMLNNSIILFLTDNGGATNGFNGNVASNWPLRGCKDTLWEGGVRGVGLIWSPLLQSVSRVHQGLVNVQDWLPTLISAISASEQISDLKDLDGVSQWAALNSQSAAPYQTMLHNIDPVRKIAALRHGKWKIIRGRTYNGTYDGHYGQLTGLTPAYDVEAIKGSLAGRAVQTTPTPLPEPEEMLALRSETTVVCNPSSVAEPPHVMRVRQADNGELYKSPVGAKGDPTECKPHLAACLFDVENDPCETQNLAAVYPEVLAQLEALLKEYHPVPPNNRPEDPRSYPENWNNTWVPWQDYV